MVLLWCSVVGEHINASVCISVEVKLLGHRLCIYSASVVTAKQTSKVIVQIYTPLSSIGIWKNLYHSRDFWPVIWPHLGKRGSLSLWILMGEVVTRNFSASRKFPQKISVCVARMENGYWAAKKKKMMVIHKSKRDMCTRNNGQEKAKSHFLVTGAWAPDCNKNNSSSLRCSTWSLFAKLVY